MKKILIAEDNDINYKLYTIILENFEVEIIRAVNGIETVELSNLNPDISLILMDIKMPLMGGEEAAVLIKKSHPNIPIISTTAYQYMWKVSEENKKYFSGFISKPFKIEEFKKIIKKYCFDEN
jgi:CheY-like chemotaxis protein